ncbi:MAG: arginase family protein [Deltaproteobacteria bacterium]|nr:arginase family protein [Deltaproteobacteria bacterium]
MTAKGNARSDSALQETEGKTVDEILERYPLRKKEARTFFAKCIQDGFLVPANDVMAAPQRIGVDHRFAHMPAYFPEKPAPFVLLGVPYDLATTGHPGARFGPSQIRGSSLAAQYSVDPMQLTPVGFADLASGQTLLQGIELADAGDVFIAPGEHQDPAFERITQVVEEVLAKGAIPLIMGGDHSISYPILRAYSRRQHALQVLHIDAHTDLGDALPGQRLHHGNVFTMVLEDFPDVEQIVQVGLRGIYDPSVLDAPVDVEAFGMDRFRREGITAVIDALDEELPVYVSFDIDGVDPSYAPSTGTPVPFGLRPDEVKDLLRAVGEARNVIGADIVEVAYSQTPHDGTGVVAAESLLTLADATVRGMRMRMRNPVKDPQKQKSEPQ